MRELDQVLARAYGARPAVTDRPAAGPGPGAGTARPRPHFALDGEPDPLPRAPADEPSLRWPDTVLALAM